MLMTGLCVLPDTDGSGAIVFFFFFFYFPHIKTKAENNFCVLLLLNSATMNIAFSFALVYSHVLDLSLCLSCWFSQRASENKAQTALLFFSF